MFADQNCCSSCFFESAFIRQSAAFLFLQMDLPNRPVTVAIGGFTSEVGKTTLLCELLAALPGWEAIKTTRGHYRSCGKDPHACCVSDLLTDEPVLRSGRAATYAAGKDTGRYWDAGAANVHWLIVTDEQVQEGIRRALDLVRAPGVLVEGNSFTEFVPVDFTLMVARADGGKIKGSARRALQRASAIYLSDVDEHRSEPDCRNHAGTAALDRFIAWRDNSRLNELRSDLPIYTRTDLPELVSRLRSLLAMPSVSPTVLSTSNQ
jgi:hypothetical protein